LRICRGTSINMSWAIPIALPRSTACWRSGGGRRLGKNEPELKKLVHLFERRRQKRAPSCNHVGILLIPVDARRGEGETKTQTGDSARRSVVPQFEWARPNQAIFCSAVSVSIGRKAAAMSRYSFRWPSCGQTSKIAESLLLRSGSVSWQKMNNRSCTQY